MVSIEFCQIKKSLVLIFALIFFISCEQEEVNTSFKESEKKFTWRMVPLGQKIILA